MSELEEIEQIKNRITAASSQLEALSGPAKALSQKAIEADARLTQAEDQTIDKIDAELQEFLKQETK